MKIAITGASGFVGRRLAPKLLEQGHEIYVVGRSIQKLLAIFGEEYSHITYEELASVNGLDSIIHLATMNNDAEASLEEFLATNVDLLRQVAAVAKQGEVAKFIYTTSLHVEGVTASGYARSKQQAETILADEFSDLDVRTFVLPAVYDDGGYAGNLLVLHRFPKFIQSFVFKVLASLRPTVHLDTLHSTVISVLEDQIEDHRIYVSDRQLNNWFYKFWMRAIDLSFSIALLVLFWWLLAIVWLCIKLTSAGPGIFAQSRIGKDGKEFVCYKFRTMQEGTKVAGTHEVSANSVTPIGRLIRKLKIDELPQVWNIIKGDMSLVGPRPCLPVQNELIEARFNRDVLDVRCGLTGLSQINDIDMSDPELLAKADARYLAIRALPLEISIIFKTFFGAGRADRVKKVENG